MQDGGFLKFLLIEGTVIYLAWLLSRMVLKRHDGIWRIALLAGLFATILVHAYAMVFERLDAFWLVSVFFGYLYGFMGALVLEYAWKQLRSRA